MLPSNYGLVFWWLHSVLYNLSVAYCAKTNAQKFVSMSPQPSEADKLCSEILPHAAETEPHPFSPSFCWAQGHHKAAMGFVCGGGGTKNQLSDMVGYRSRLGNTSARKRTECSEHADFKSLVICKTHPLGRKDKARTHCLGT